MKNTKCFMFIIIILTISAACSTSGLSKEFSKDFVIKYRENGTPSYIKGKNLTSHLDGDQHFEMLKRNRNYVEIAYRFLESRTKFFKIKNPRAEFQMTKVSTDDLQYKHVKFRQVVNNVPIWGREIIIHLNRDNEVYMVNGNIEPSVNINTTPKLINKEAAKRALEAVPGGPEGWHVAGSEIQVFFAKPGAPCLVYMVTLVKGIASREYYFIDAKDGTFLHKISGTPSPKQKSAPGYDGIKIN